MAGIVRDFEPIPYYELQSTRTFRNIPRFGHTNDFSKLFSDNGDEVNDYSLGLLFAGTFIFAIFLSWALILLILKCVGQKTFGFMAGAAFQGEISRRSKTVRIVFLISGALVIIFAVLGVTEGLTNLYNTVDTVNLSAKAINEVSTNASDIIKSYGEARNATVQLLPELSAVIQNFCPAFPELLKDETGIDFQNISTAVLDGLRALGDFIADQVAEVEKTVNDVRETSRRFIEETDDIKVSDWQSLIVIIPWSSVTSILMLGAVLAMFDFKVGPLLCLLDWVILPLFIIMTVAAFVLTSVMALGASANADFCSGGEQNTPNATIENVLIKNGLMEEDLTFQIVRFYSSQCTESVLLEGLQAFIVELAEALKPIENLRSASDDVTFATLAQICGADYMYIALLLLQKFISYLEVMIQSLTDLLLLLICSSIVPIYVNTFNTGTCEYTIKGFTWFFSSFLVVAFFGMLMVTFRSSVRPNNRSVEKKQLHDQEIEPPIAEVEVASDTAALAVEQSSHEDSEDYPLAVEQSSQEDELRSGSEDEGFPSAQDQPQYDIEHK